MSHFETLFKEALAYAVARNVVPSDEYYNEMTALQRQRAISIKGLASLEQIRHIMMAVNQALADGETFEDFKKRVGKADIELPHHRLDNIYRTNLQSAYNRGKWYEQRKNKAKRPYLMYSAINDSRTRPDHKSRHGIIRHIDDEFWDNNYPPLGFRCRCTTRAITKKQMEHWGLTPKRELPPDVEGDFGGSPKKYGRQFNRLVRDVIAKIMIENPKADLKAVADKLEQAKNSQITFTNLDELLEFVREKQNKATNKR